MSILGIMRDQIVETFNKDELRDLCFDLQIDYDELIGDTKSTKVTNLLLYLQRRGRLNALVFSVKKLRPHLVWPTATELEAEISQGISSSLLDPPKGAVTQSPSHRVLYAAIAVILVLVVALVIAINNSSKPAGTGVIDQPSGAIEITPSLVATFTEPPPTSSAVFSSTRVNVMHVTTYEGVTMTVDYVAFESNRVMIHITLDNSEHNFAITNCRFPTLIKSGYGPVPKENIIERGGFVSKGSESCILAGNIIVEPGVKQEGWITYQVDASRFITTGLYTLGDVTDRLPTTTFEIK